jgi:hypothetical protein
MRLLIKYTGCAKRCIGKIGVFTPVLRLIRRFLRLHFVLERW